MKKIMKKAVAVVSCVLLVASFAACGASKVPCDICGKEANCTKVEYLGQKANVCSDCKKGIDAVSDALGALSNLF